MVVETGNKPLLAPGFIGLGYKGHALLRQPRAATLADAYSADSPLVAVQRGTRLPNPPCFLHNPFMMIVQQADSA